MVSGSGFSSQEWQIVREDNSLMNNEDASTRALKDNRLIENVAMGIVKIRNRLRIYY